MFKNYFGTYLLTFMMQCLTAEASLQRSNRHKTNLFDQTFEIEVSQLQRSERVLQSDYRGTRRERSQSSYEYLQGRQNNVAYYTEDSGSPWEIDSKSIVFLMFPVCVLIILTISCWKRGCRLIGCEVECCTSCCIRLKQRQDEDDRNQHTLRKSVTIQIEEYYKKNPQIERTDFSGAKGMRRTSNKERNWARTVETLDASQKNLVQAKTKPNSRNLKKIDFENTM